jgi:hypothetical protein
MKLEQVLKGEVLFHDRITLDFKTWKVAHNMAQARREFYLEDVGSSFL